MFILSLQSDLIFIGITLVIATIVIWLLLYFYRRNINIRIYKKAKKRFNKLKEKNYNANVYIEQILNRYTTDQTNTYSSLKKAGKRKVRKYVRFYQKELPKLVEAKSNISPNKKRKNLVFIFKNQSNQIVGQYQIKQSFKKLRKQLNKHQLLLDMIAYLYEVSNHIVDGKSYALENHDNHHFISYEIIE